MITDNLLQEKEIEMIADNPLQEKKKVEVEKEETIDNSLQEKEEKKKEKEEEEILPPVDPKDQIINHLVFCRYNECMLCKNVKKEGEHNLMLIGDYLSGWYYCDECARNQRLVRAIHGYIMDTMIVPMCWLNKYLRNNNTEKNMFMYFYRNSQKKIQIGELSDEIENNVLIFSEKHDSYRLVLSFRLEDTGEKASRGVSLQNLFAHNHWLYEELIKCDDLLDSHDLEIPIKISYRQLPESVRMIIEKAYELSKNPSDSFLY